MEARIGIDVGKDRVRGGPGKLLADMFLAEHGIVLLPDIHGVAVYPDDGKHQIAGGSAAGQRALGEERFVELLSKYDSTSEPLPRAIRVAAELLSASYFGKSSYATLILSIAAVEAATPTSKRSSEYLRLLKLAMNAVADDDSGSEDKEVLARELEGLGRQRDGIRKSCFNLVRDTLDRETAVERAGSANSDRSIGGVSA